MSLVQPPSTLPALHLPLSRRLKGNRVTICADILSALLLRAIGQKLQKTYRMNLKRLGVLRSSGDRDPSRIRTYGLQKAIMPQRVLKLAIVNVGRQDTKKHLEEHVSNLETPKDD